MWMSRRDRVARAWSGVRLGAWIARGVVGALVAALVGGLAEGAHAAPIGMPAGSTVWMHVEASACPDEDGDDCIGSNLPGMAPPNGIPLTTFADGGQYATVYAEVLPDRVRTFLQNRFSSTVRASFEDTYTVHGAVAGTFPITVTLSAAGTASSVPITSFLNALASPGLQLEIGVFDHTPGVGLEGGRVISFGGAAFGTWNYSTTSGPAPFSVPVSAIATYTLNVGVGDIFPLAYGINSATANGEIDLLADGAVISFDLPEGVWLTSTLGGAWGVVPEPSTFSLTALGVGAFAARGRGRRG